MSVRPPSTLVIRPGALGDSILTLPALHALWLSGAENLVVLGTSSSWAFVRKAHDGLRIRDFSSSDWMGLFSNDVALGESARGTLQHTDSAVIYLTGDMSVAVNALKAHGVQKVLCIPAPLAVYGISNEPHASRQLTAGLSAWVAPHFIEEAHAITEAANDVFLRFDEDERHRALFAIGLDAVPAKGFVAIHPGSGGRKKCWPAEHFARVATKLACRDGVVPLVFFGPAETEIRETFESAIPPGVDWQPVQDRPLREVLALLSLSRGYVGNDSGITHLAARACPTLAIFGPSNSQVWAPVGKSVRILQAPEGDLSRLSVDEVLEKLEDTMTS